MHTHDFKLVAGGDSRKYYLIRTFNGDKYCERDIPSIFKGYEQDDVKYSIRLCDNPSSDAYDSTRSICFCGSDVVLLCFTLDDRQTLQDLHERWIMEVEYYCKDVRIILVGMNSDLRRIGNPNHVSDEETL